MKTETLEHEQRCEICDVPGLKLIKDRTTKLFLCEYCLDDERSTHDKKSVRRMRNEE